MPLLACRDRRKIYCTCSKGSLLAHEVSDLSEVLYQEGERRYVTHLVAERSKTVVYAVKNARSWFCEIFSLDFHKKYGVRYIEAYPKTPISTYSEKYAIKPQDLALLCPNCHKAVHVLMKESNIEYNEIIKKG